MTEHTPKPAVIHGQGFNSQGGGFSAIYIDGIRYEPDDVRRAVNSHADLLAALRALVAKIDEHGASNRVRFAACGFEIVALQNARAALAKAGGA